MGLYLSLHVELEEDVDVPKSYTSERLQVRDALARSALEVDPSFAEYHYRPMARLNEVLQYQACVVDATSVHFKEIKLNAFPVVDGLCKRYVNEISAERGVCLVAEQKDSMVWVMQQFMHDELLFSNAIPLQPTKGSSNLEVDMIHTCSCSDIISLEEAAGMATAYERVRRRLENAWHERSWIGHTNDPHAHEHKSTEFGWSTMPGGSTKQKHAQCMRRPFQLKSMLCDEGCSFFDMYLRPILPLLWKKLMEYYPSAGASMLAQVPVQYRLCGTAFTKVTVAVNNPTPLHVDYNNVGITALICFDVSDGSTGSLVGGSHVIIDTDFRHAIIIKDTRAGVMILGDYKRILHGNFATQHGRRFIVSAYTSRSLLTLVNP